MRLWFDDSLKKVYTDFNSTTEFTNPVFTVGDTATIELFRVRSGAATGDIHENVPFPTNAIVRLGLGKLTEAPASGTWKISGGSDLAYNATAAAVQTAINASLGASTVSVTGDDGGPYTVTWAANGAQTLLAFDDVALFPTSTAHVRRVRTGTASVPEIQRIALKQTVVAWQDTWTDFSSSEVSVAELVEGETSVSEVQRVSISNYTDVTSGTFTLTYPPGDKGVVGGTSSAIAFDATAEQVLAAIEPLAVGLVVNAFGFGTSSPTDELAITTDGTNLANPVTLDIFPGMAVTGANVPDGTTVLSVTSTYALISAATTGSTDGSPLTFTGVAGQFAVSKAGNGVWDITFQGGFTNYNHSLLTASSTNLISHTGKVGTFSTKTEEAESLFSTEDSQSLYLELEFEDEDENVTTAFRIAATLDPAVINATGNLPSASESATIGDDGWTPVFAVVTDSARRVLQVGDWTGGTGTKPATGKYVGVSGLVTLIADGVDIRGSTGATGPMPDLASPGPIGGTTPGSGTFTTISVGGSSLVLGGNLTTAGAFALTLTLTAATTVTMPTMGTVTTEERLMRQKRFAVGVSAATISTSNSAWSALITNGSSGITRLHSYFNFGTSASLAGSKYTFWVEAGAASVVPQAFAGHPFYGLNFAKGLEVSFPLQIAQRTSSTAVLPSDGYLSGYFGQSRNTHYEDIVQVGFGFLLKGDGTIQLQALATNGGSVVKSSFVASGLDMSVNASAVASLIRVTSDTAGNLTLFVDGVSKCTLAGGPTGLTNVSTSSFSVWTFTISNGAGTPTKATECTIGEPIFIL